MENLKLKISSIDQIAKDIFVLFGSTVKTCKVEYNVKNGTVRKMNKKTVLSKNSIVLDRKVLEKLSQKVNIDDLETRMIETIKRGILKLFETQFKNEIIIINDLVEQKEQITQQKIDEVEANLNKNLVLLSEHADLLIPQQIGQLLKEVNTQKVLINLLRRFD